MLTKNGQYEYMLKADNVTDIQCMVKAFVENDERTHTYEITY